VDGQLPAAAKAHRQRDVGVVRHDADAAAQRVEVALLVRLRLEVLADQVREHDGQTIAVRSGGQLDVGMQGATIGASLALRVKARATHGVT
jgi:hypothetical protein